MSLSYKNQQSALSALNPHIRIIIASGIYPPDIGGPAIYSQLIAREFTKRGIEVSLICYSDKKQKDNEEFKITRILRNNKLVRYFLYFFNLLKLSKNCDAIYAQGPLSAGLPAMWVSRILRKKFVIKIVGDYAWEQYANSAMRISSALRTRPCENAHANFDNIEDFQNKKYNWKVELIRKVQKIVVRNANKVIVPSEFLKRIVKGWGVDENKIKVIYNAGPEIEKLGCELKLEGDAIISAGRLEPWKGMEALVEIMPNLLKENSNFRLIIVGRGPENDNLKFKIKNLKLENEVRLIDRLPQQELLKYFKASKMFVLNTAYEGLSHILLEAMATSLPVVTTNVCGNPEVVKDGYNGLLVEYNNKKQLKEAILRIWKDKNLREKLINNGYKTLERFKLERMVNETMNILNLRSMSARGGSASGGKLLMITGDRALAQGKKGPFYYMLEEFSRHWERIDIICPKTKQKVFNVFKNVYIHSSTKPLFLHPFFILKRGLEVYRKEKFDLFTIHSYPPFYNDIGGRWLYNKIKVPYILEIMHITGYPKAGNFKEWIYKNLTRLFIKYFTRKALVVRTINQNQVPGFLKKAGIDEKKIRYIPAFYLDFGIFKPIPMEKKYDIVFSGRLVKNKGIMLLLKAVKKIKNSRLLTSKQNSNIKLIIIGDGPLRFKIEKYIKRNNLQNNIEFGGWLPSINDLAKIYNQSKIFVMPSFNEGGPRVCLEAMACKLPVITTRVGAMIDVVKDNENGLFIDWSAEDIAQKIILLLKDENLRKKIAENGYSTVQQFERKKMIKNYAENYQKLI